MVWMYDIPGPPLRKWSLECPPRPPAHITHSSPWCSQRKALWRMTLCYFLWVTGFYWNLIFHHLYNADGNLNPTEMGGDEQVGAQQIWVPSRSHRVCTTDVTVCDALGTLSFACKTPPPPQFYWGVIHKWRLYVFKANNVMVWYIYCEVIISHTNEHIHPLTQLLLSWSWSSLLLLVVWEHRVYLLANFKSTIEDYMVTMLDIRSPELNSLYNRKFVPFD